MAEFIHGQSLLPSGEKVRMRGGFVRFEHLAHPPHPNPLPQGGEGAKYSV